MNTTEKRANIKVLMYHRIVEKPSGEISNPHSVSEEDFRSQLKMLEALNYTPVTFEDYHLYVRGELTLPKKPIILTFDDGYLDTFETALPILRDFNMKAVLFVMGDRHRRKATWDENSEEYPLMSDEHIVEARAEGFEIGAHTISHLVLPELPEKELRREVFGSKKKIESVLGEEIISFSYPYGRLNKRVRSVVEESGFRFACGVYTGPPTFGDDLYDIRRLSINRKTGIAAYLLKILTPYQYVEWLYGKIRHRNSYYGYEPDEKNKEIAVDEYDYTPTNNY